MPGQQTFLNHRSLWPRISKNTDWSTGPLARPFAHSLAPLTHSIAPHYSLRSRSPLCSAALTRLLTSLTPSLVGKSILAHSADCLWFGDELKDIENSPRSTTKEKGDGDGEKHDSQATVLLIATRLPGRVMHSGPE